MGEFAGIQATVLQKNNEQFFCDPCGNFGRTLNIPCGSAAAKASDEQYYAVPVVADVVQGFVFEIASSAPTIDSIQVFKLTNLQNGDFYWVVGTTADYYTKCAACCDASPVPTLVHSEAGVSIAPTQETCTTDGGTTYTAMFAIPDLPSGHYVARVTQNGALIFQQTYGTGSTSKANLVIYLNAHAGALGTWSNPVGNAIKLVAASAMIVGFIACVKTS